MQFTAQNKKYLRKIFLGLVVIGLAILFLRYVWDHTKSNNFPIKNVKIFATYEHVNQKALQKTIADYLNSGFFYLKTISLKHELLKFPWIYAVHIQRKWPDTLNINIAEQKAFLQWGTQALINPDGKIFSPPPATFPKDLPIIFGPQEQEPEIFALYQKILSSLAPLDLVIKKMVLSPEHFWEIMLSNNTVIYLKEEDPLNQIELLTSVYRKITAERERSPKSIDLRYQTGLAVKWEA